MDDGQAFPILDIFPAFWWKIACLAKIKDGLCSSQHSIRHLRRMTRFAADFEPTPIATAACHRRCRCLCRCCPNHHSSPVDVCLCLCVCARIATLKNIARDSNCGSGINEHQKYHNWNAVPHFKIALRRPVARVSSGAMCRKPLKRIETARLFYCWSIFPCCERSGCWCESARGDSHNK